MTKRVPGNYVEMPTYLSGIFCALKTVILLRTRIKLSFFYFEGYVIFRACQARKLLNTNDVLDFVSQIVSSAQASWKTS